MKQGMICGAAVLACVWLFAGCKGKEKASVQETALVASVNGVAITGAEVEREVNNLIQQFGGQIPPEQMNQIQPRLQRQALDNLINMKLLGREAERSEITIDPEEVTKRIDEIAKRFPSVEEFQKQLAASGMTERALRGQIEQALKIESMIEGKTGEATEVTEEEISAFYEENPENFQMPERVQASHILIGVADDDDESAKEEKQQQLTDLRRQILEGADFAELAEQYSSCPSKAKGGDLGFFTRGQMVKPFEDVAFALATGELSDVVETQFGYHLIKVSDHEEERELPLEAVQDRIKAFLENRKREQAVNDYIIQLRNAATIEYGDAFQPPPST
jgi:peptidyl-prolyl cis-trans isomerase C